MEKELQKAINLAIYDLQIAQKELESNDIDTIENALCRIDNLLFDLQQTRKAYINACNQ